MKKGRQRGLPKVTRQVSSNQQGYMELMQQTLGARGAEGSGVGVGHSVPRMLSPHFPYSALIAGTVLPARYTRSPMAPPLHCPSCPVRSQCYPFSTAPRCLSTSVQASASLPPTTVIAFWLLGLQAHLSTIQPLYSYQP